MICEFEHHGVTCRVYKEGKETKVKIAGRVFHITALTGAMRKVVLDQLNAASAPPSKVKQKPASKPQNKRKASNDNAITRYAVTATGKQPRKNPRT